MTQYPPGNNTLCIAKAAAIFFAIIPYSAASISAFHHGGALCFGQNSSRRCSTSSSSSRITSSPSPLFKQSIGSSSTSIHVSRDQTRSSADSIGLGFDDEEHTSYPVKIRHQGHEATISVRKNEPILQALERQSTFSSGSTQQEASLALSTIPNECRRGNCLTCSSRIIDTESNAQNIQANVDNGLTPTVSSELTKEGYILTCCSYITGPGVALELDQNDEVWDVVYRQRICSPESKQAAMEAQARLLRRVDEKNVGKWKRKMQKILESEDDNSE